LNGQTFLLERTMSELTKADCISIEIAISEAGVSKGSFYTYMNALGVQRHKFPFDRKAYITKRDNERIKQFIAENRG
jgi:hypothetical protein